MATTVPGIFAAGDVTTSFGEQVLIAIGDGARAALSAYDYLLMRAPRLCGDAVRNLARSRFVISVGDAGVR
jgi:pyruvate/2-oxoglutarate dehydrogenase complex dihydrolipoamide dehydrogenase (E3) component